MERISSKTLSNTDIRDKFSMETSSLHFLPPFSHGQNFQNLYVEDDEENEWCFRLFIRGRGRYPKPVLSAGWRRFVRDKGLRRGFKVEFFRERDQATGGFKFKIRISRPVLLFKAIIGYN